MGVLTVILPYITRIPTVALCDHALSRPGFNVVADLSMWRISRAVDRTETQGPPPEINIRQFSSFF